jgi:hypothetical protein
LFGLLAPEALSWGIVVRSSSDALWYALFVVFTFGGGLLGGFLGYQALRDDSTRELVTAQVLLYLAAILGALVLSALQIPALPVVELDSDSSNDSERLSLLGHADGYWYVFDSDGNLSVVSDDRTDKVRFLQRIEP